MSTDTRAIVPLPAQMTSPYLDEPGRRLIWTLPMALLIWLALLFGFSRMLELTAPPPPELKPVEARIVELPPETGGLQGGPAPAAPAKPKPAVIRHAPVVHPHVAPHPHFKVPPAAPPIAPSETGTAKSAAPPQPSSGAPAPSEGARVPGGSGAASGAGLGSDTAGARAIFAPTPTIPDDLREDALNAVAVAHFKVGYDGQVEVTLAKPTSNPELNQMLLDSLKQWKFFPAMRNGVAIPSEFDVRIPITVQ
ncbi:MAG: periplasmic protein TonB [Candidatus Binataceae bacterium]|nr:periplasmic protein TonB [Candidatus Binataceae bacterium]